MFIIRLKIILFNKAYSLWLPLPQLSHDPSPSYADLGPECWRNSHDSLSFPLLSTEPVTHCSLTLLLSWVLVWFWSWISLRSFPSLSAQCYRMENTNSYQPYLLGVIDVDSMCVCVLDMLLTPSRLQLETHNLSQCCLNTEHDIDVKLLVDY